MNYTEFLTRIINDGIEAAKNDYVGKEDKLKGSIAGFEACRGKNPDELKELLSKAAKDTFHAHMKHIPNYWEIRCFEAEVEWVCNCVSAMLMNEKLPTIIPPTARAVIKVAEVIGVSPITALN